MLGYPLSGNGRRQAFWSYVVDDDSNSNSNPDSDDINSKVYSAFDAVKSFPFKRIIFQFWRPFSAAGGRQVLQSLRSAYAFPPYDRHLSYKYMARCPKYQYTTEVGNPKPAPAWIISGGPVVAAFRNRFPEVVLDLKELAGSLLVDFALESELTCCVMIPVFLADECLGVVECSAKHPSLLVPIFYELKRELEVFS